MAVNEWREYRILWKREKAPASGVTQVYTSLEVARVRMLALQRRQGHPHGALESLHLEERVLTCGEWGAFGE